MRPSVVIPAHNEERAIARTLESLLADAANDEFEVVVVANGCDDHTAAVASKFDGVDVIETPIASKPHALRLGDEHVHGFPRVYLDGDVEMTTDSLRELCTSVSKDGTLAAGPVRAVPMDGASWPVRWYYDVWLQLPTVRNELFGRGAIAVSEAGHGRVSGFADVMSDDLAATIAFDAAESAVTHSATSIIRPPRTYRDLVRRRVRAMAGNRQLADTTSRDDRAIPSRRPAPRNNMKDLTRVCVTRPWLLPKGTVFVATALLSRQLAKRYLRTDGATWLRDESSRSG